MLDREELLKALRPIINGTISKKLYKDNSTVIGELRIALGRLLWVLDNELKPYTDKKRTKKIFFTLIYDDYVIWTDESLLIDPNDWNVWSISDLEGNNLAYYNRLDFDPYKDKKYEPYKNRGLNFTEAENIIKDVSRKWRDVIGSENLSGYFEKIIEHSIELLGALLNK